MDDHSDGRGHIMERERNEQLAIRGIVQTGTQTQVWASARRNVARESMQATGKTEHS